VDAAREQLANPGERPVSQFHAEKAVERLPGIGQLADALVAELDKVEDEATRAALRPPLEQAAAQAKAALDGFGTWLHETLLPAATGDFHNAINFAGVFKAPCVLVSRDSRSEPSKSGGVSLADRAAPELRSFFIVDGEVTEEELTIT